VSSTDTKLRIGFIPLADAAALIVAADRGFAADEGLDIELVREVSWSNVRDKLNIGLFDAAHLIAPIAVASNLGIGHVKVPLVAPFGLGVNGNAITVTPALYAEMAAAADGNILDPMVSARALKRVVEARKAKGKAPLMFGMTFPFSTHNYHIRFWMAAGGVDPDEDVQLVVLPPPYMVDSLASGHVDGFCVGAPWNSVAVDLGVGVILHFVCEILSRAMEKLLAVRADWAEENPDVLLRLVRAHRKAADFIEDTANREEVAAILAAPNRIDVAAILAVPNRADVASEVIRRTLDGRMKVTPNGAVRIDDRYLLVGRDGAARPDPVQAAWLYAQMVRWGQAPLSPELLAAARGVVRPDLYDAAMPGNVAKYSGDPADGIGAFTGPQFDPNDIAGYLASWTIKRSS
jgi:NitT/TauT family transport system ATP-binding protein